MAQNDIKINLDKNLTSFLATRVFCDADDCEFYHGSLESCGLRETLITSDGKCYYYDCQIKKKNAGDRESST